MDTYVQELQSATEFVRQLFADRQIELDYTPQSVQHLDDMFDQEFKQGELIDTVGLFAQYQGLIMTGISGYIAQVILQHTDNAQLSFEEDDENWFVNFSLETDNEEKFIPGHKVLKRAYHGEKEQLYTYVVEAISYLQSPTSHHHPDHLTRLFSKSSTTIDGKDKPWWKLWNFLL